MTHCISIPNSYGCWTSPGASEVAPENDATKAARTRVEVGWAVGPERARGGNTFDLCSCFLPSPRGFPPTSICTCFRVATSPSHRTARRSHRSPGHGAWGSWMLRGTPAAPGMSPTATKWMQSRPSKRIHADSEGKQSSLCGKLICHIVHQNTFHGIGLDMMPQWISIWAAPHRRRCTAPGALPAFPFAQQQRESWSKHLVIPA